MVNDINGVLFFLGSFVALVIAGFIVIAWKLHALEKGVIAVQENKFADLFMGTDETEADKFEFTSEHTTTNNSAIDATVSDGKKSEAKN